MSVPQESTDHQDPNFFRCPVQAEQSEALVRDGRRRTRVLVQETSIDGFTILVSPKDSSRLRVGRNWVLEHQGARIEVHPQWMFNSPDGHVQMGLRRLRDLTPPDPIKTSLLTRFGGRRYEDPSYAAAAFGGFVLFLFSLMALPGLGDKLGTSVRIQRAVQWLVNGFNESFGSYL